ncbi:hypothetical protein [Mycoplasma sp. ATU-Cv-508]|uniref:hypothetical protein n=1 Tax=Mycoplasma sp. ATU-Cv-508 TaxID=2048001 RepID=UPI000FDE7B4A
MVIGDANKRDSIGDGNFFEKIWNKNRDKLPLILEEKYTDYLDPVKKSSISLGTKRGKATKMEQIYVFRKKDLALPCI